LLVHFVRLKAQIEAERDNGRKALVRNLQRLLLCYGGLVGFQFFILS